MKINYNEVKFSPISVDSVGSLFFWQNKIFRAIKKESVADIKNLFSSGMVDELVLNNLFPKSWITDYELDHYGLVIEHEKINVVVCPYEWSFNMLKEAALTVLRVNRIAKKYGYQTKDCHGANILFDNMSPKFVDLGSFVRINEGAKGWLAYEDFLRIYFNPIKIWANGNMCFARAVFLTNKYPALYEYFLYYNPLYRFLSLNWLEKTIKLFFRYKQIASIKSEKIILKLRPRWLARIVVFLKEHNLLPFLGVNFDAIIIKIEKIKPKKVLSEWGNYHDDLSKYDAILGLPHRLKRILEIINLYDIKSIVELGGNQGIFSKLIIENTKVKNIVCTDYDEVAIDALYGRFKKQKISLTPAVLDFIFPDELALDQKPATRFKSDAVLVLAVTHHLLLRQNIPLDYILSTILKYTNQYVFIEFMPIGLYSGDSTKVPPLPSWYTLDWFKSNFRKYFNLILEEKTEENRILFVGERK